MNNFEKIIISFDFLEVFLFLMIAVIIINSLVKLKINEKKYINETVVLSLNFSYRRPRRIVLEKIINIVFP